MIIQNEIQFGQAGRENSAYNKAVAKQHDTLSEDCNPFRQSARMVGVKRGSEGENVRIRSNAIQMKSIVHERGIPKASSCLIKADRRRL